MNEEVIVFSKRQGNVEALIHVITQEVGRLQRVQQKTKVFQGKLLWRQKTPIVMVPNCNSINGIRKGGSLTREIGLTSSSSHIETIKDAACVQCAATSNALSMRNYDATAEKMPATQYTRTKLKCNRMPFSTRKMPKFTGKSLRAIKSDSVSFFP